MTRALDKDIRVSRACGKHPKTLTGDVLALQELHAPLS